MRYLRKWIRNVFGFSGNEINGFLILIPLLLVLVFSEPFYERRIRSQERDYTRDFQMLDSLASLWETPPAGEDAQRPPVAVTRFDFDPNAASVEVLRQLGFSNILANRIAAYRRKGGVFRTKSDLLKIYGLDSTLYRQLHGYISLPERRLERDEPQRRPEKTFFPKVSENRNNPREKARFDINIADTAELKGLYGIGSTLAARIVKFRDLLGGFVTMQQLYEVYGLDSMVVKRLWETSFIGPEFAPRQININTADELSLSRHPYINRRLARVLVAYRFQHGDFREVGDIKKLSVVSPAETDRLLPYLKVKD